MLFLFSLFLILLHIPFNFYYHFLLFLYAFVFVIAVLLRSGWCWKKNDKRRKNWAATNHTYTRVCVCVCRIRRRTKCSRICLHFSLFFIWIILYTQDNSSFHLLSCVCVVVCQNFTLETERKNIQGKEKKTKGEENCAMLCRFVSKHTLTERA